MISDQWDKVEAIAEALLKYETLQSQEVLDLINGRALDRPSVADLLDDESDAANSPTSTPATEDPEEGPSGGFVPSPA